MAEGYRKLGRKDFAQKAETYAKQMDALAKPVKKPEPLIDARLRQRREQRLALAP